jgi:hypothetical protein
VALMARYVRCGVVRVKEATNEQPEGKMYIEHVVSIVDSLRAIAKGFRPLELPSSLRIEKSPEEIEVLKGIAESLASISSSLRVIAHERRDASARGRL